MDMVKEDKKVEKDHIYQHEKWLEYTIAKQWHRIWKNEKQFSSKSWRKTIKWCLLHNL